MSNEKKPIKITMEDSKKFYDEVYKSTANDVIDSLTPEEQSSIKGDTLSLRQNQYRQLAVDFMKVTKDRNIGSDESIKYLGMSSESWNIWRSSVQLGANKKHHVTPITFNNDIIMRMSGMVLKDALSKYMVENNLNEVSKDDMNTVFELRKIQLAQNSNLNNLNLNNDPVKPAQKNKNKP